MADYYTHFSCLLEVGTPENAARALDLYNALSDENAAEDPPSDGFLLSIQPEHGGTQLWMRDDVTGDPEQMIRLLNSRYGNHRVLVSETDPLSRHHPHTRQTFRMGPQPFRLAERPGGYSLVLVYEGNRQLRLESYEYPRMRESSPATVWLMGQGHTHITLPVMDTSARKVDHSLRYALQG